MKSSRQDRDPENRGHPDKQERLAQENGRTERARAQTRLVIGPWNHSTLGRRQQGEIDFGPDAELDLQHAMIRWFDYWLKDLGNGTDREPPVRYFVMGSGKWKSAGTWPRT